MVLLIEIWAFSEAMRGNEIVLSRGRTESGFCFGKVTLATTEAGWITEGKPHWRQSHQSLGTLAVMG